MSDKIDHVKLYKIAESQAGYFTSRDAMAVGMDRSTLSHHARPGGKFERARRGVYRFRDFPSSPHEHVVAAWLSVDDDDAVVSHESALELFDLADVIPDAVHISLPRGKRGQRKKPGVRIHALVNPPRGSEIRRVHAIPVTTPERTIVDAIAGNTQPEQVEMAVRQALARGLTTPRRLTDAAANRSRRIRKAVAHSLDGIDS